MINFTRNRLPSGWTSSNFFGYKIYHLVGEIVMQQLKKGKYESKSVDIVREWHVGSAVGIDIGANIGLFSLQLLNSGLNKDSIIYAFEPNPLTFSRLQLTIQENSLFNNIVVYPLAVSENTELLHFSAHADISSSGDGIFDTGRAGSVKNIIIHTTTIDNFIAQLSLKRLDWIKIDVEGAELLVFQGGVNTIRTFRPKIIFEIHRDNIKPYGISTSEIFAFINNLNYKIYDTNFHELDAKELNYFVEVNKGDANYIALPANN